MYLCVRDECVFDKEKMKQISDCLFFFIKIIPNEKVYISR